MCLETGMRGVNRGKSRRQYQGLTYRYYLLVLRKDHSLIFNFQITKNIQGDLRDLKIPTWHDIVASVMEEIGGTATLAELYSAVEGHKRTQYNKNWQDKIRQTLQMYDEFEAVQRGVWRMCRSHTSRPVQKAS